MKQPDSKASMILTFGLRSGKPAQRCLRRCRAEPKREHGPNVRFSLFKFNFSFFLKRRFLKFGVPKVSSESCISSEAAAAALRLNLQVRFSARRAVAWVPPALCDAIPRCPGAG